MGLFICQQIGHTKSDIKELMEMVYEQRMQLRIPTIRGKLFPYYIYIYIYIAMKKCYYEDPIFKLCRGPGAPLLNFEGGPGVPVLNFRGVPAGSHF